VASLRVSHVITVSCAFQVSGWLPGHAFARRALAGHAKVSCGLQRHAALAIAGAAMVCIGHYGTQRYYCHYVGHARQVSLHIAIGFRHCNAARSIYLGRYYFIFIVMGE
jgi:hypothetical protein